MKNIRNKKKNINKNEQLITELTVNCQSCAVALFTPDY